MRFAGFDRSALAKLEELPNRTAAKYAAERSQLAAGLVEPGTALSFEVAASLDKEFTVVRRSSVSPLHRDLRFAPAGATKHKDHLLRTTRLGTDKQVSPTGWIRIDSEFVGFATGLNFGSCTRDRWRDAVADRRGESLERSIAKLANGKPYRGRGQGPLRLQPFYGADHLVAEPTRRGT